VLGGLILGLVLGLILGPVIRSWLAWREYTEASRAARLADDVLRRMSDSATELDSASRR
jgi:hypothetical protein